MGVRENKNFEIPVTHKESIRYIRDTVVGDYM